MIDILEKLTKVTGDVAYLETEVAYMKIFKKALEKEAKKLQKKHDAKLKQEGSVNE